MTLSVSAKLVSPASTAPAFILGAVQRVAQAAPPAPRRLDPEGVAAFRQILGPAFHLIPPERFSYHLGSDFPQTANRTDLAGTTVSRGTSRTRFAIVWPEPAWGTWRPAGVDRGTAERATAFQELLHVFTASDRPEDWPLPRLDRQAAEIVGDFGTLIREPRYASVLLGLSLRWEAQGVLPGYDSTHVVSLRALGRLAGTLGFGRGSDEERGRQLIALLRDTTGVTDHGQLTPAVLEDFGRRTFQRSDFLPLLQASFRQTYLEETRKLGFSWL